MTTSVSNATIDGWRGEALTYLRTILRDRAPAQLGAHYVFDESPLEGEGPIALFEFELAQSSQSGERCYVAGGRTEPNYYCAPGLTPDDAFALHLGTRFMLVLGVGVAAEAMRGGIDPGSEVRKLVDSIRPGEPVSDVEWAASFEVEGRPHGVARCRIAGQDAYAFICDAPPGFSTQVYLAPQVAYRIHLGRALLAEQSRGDDEAEAS